MARETGLRIARRTLAQLRAPAAIHFASGHCLPIAAELPETGAAVVGVSTEEDLRLLKQACRGRIGLLGNLNGIAMRRWTPEQAEAEVDAAVAGDPALAHIQLHGFPARCGAPPLTVEEVGGRLGPIGGDEPVAWIGGSCLGPWCRQRQAPDAPAAEPARVHFDCLRQCFHLVANPDTVDAWLRAGAYLCTPSWLTSAAPSFLARSRHCYKAKDCRHRRLRHWILESQLSEATAPR
jgi:hypothetical protein